MKSRLEEEKKRLDTQLAKLITNNSDGSSERVEWTDMGSKDDENAAEVATYAEKLAIQQNLSHTLLDVTTALQKIAEGTYGLCVRCGKKIDEKRLEAFPAAMQHTECSV